MNARPIPLRGSPAALIDGSVTSLTRACIASLRHAYDPTRPPAAVLARSWGNDRAAAMLLETRAAVAPLKTTDASGLALASTVVADFVESLSPASAGARLLRAALQLSFDGASQISVPAFVASAAHVSWVDELAPIPVRQLNSLGGPLLSPDKLAVIVVLSHEMIAHSNAEAMVRDALTRSAGLALDASLFDASPGDATRPAGLRNGIAPLTASTSTDVPEAMLSDVSAIVAAVSSVAGNSPVYLIAGPSRGVGLQLRAPRELPYQVLISSAVAPGDLIAVAPSALVSATGDVEIKAARETALQMSDPASNIVTGGVMASPVYSQWQTDCVGLKLHLTASWALRDPRALAWLTGLTKW